MGTTRKEILVNGVWLITVGRNIEVLIERDGVWYEAISEPWVSLGEGVISHEITASGIEAMNRRASWLDGDDPHEVTK